MLMNLLYNAAFSCSSWSCSAACVPSRAPKDSQYREYGFYNPSFTIAYATLPVLIVCQLRYHRYFPWIATPWLAWRVLSYLDPRYDIVVVQKTLQIATFGQDKDGILAGIHNFPIHKLILLHYKDDTKLAEEFAGNLRSTLGILITLKLISQPDIIRSAME